VPGGRAALAARVVEARRRETETVMALVSAGGRGRVSRVGPVRPAGPKGWTGRRTDGLTGPKSGEETFSE
jgi:hypothetical protein